MKRAGGRVPGSRRPRCVLWLALALSLLGAVPARAGDWEGDYEPGEWLIMTLVANHEGYREAEKLAVGCSEQALFVERYSPAGARPSSSLSLDGGAALTVSWDRLDAPNAMWVHGVIARTLVLQLLSARQATFRELDEPARAPVSFDLAGRGMPLCPCSTGAEKSPCWRRSEQGQRHRDELTSQFTRMPPSTGRHWRAIKRGSPPVDA
jgi:hypothetical protein